MCTDTVMSVLPLADVLDMTSGDNYPHSVIGILDQKRQDDWYPAVVESLRQEGFTKGIRINDLDTVVDGHHRIAAAMELGMEFIPVETACGAEYDREFRIKALGVEIGAEVSPPWQQWPDAS